MFRTLKISLTVVLGLCCGSWAFAEETPLQHFTKDVDVLIRLREPDRTMEKVIKLVNQVQPGVGDAIQSQQTAVLGKLISNPTLTGVDQSRDWYAGVYMKGEAPPVVVFAIPAIKADDLKGALGPDMTTKVVDRWVIYTEEDSIPAADRTNSASTHLKEAGIASLTSGDLNLYFNLEHLSEVYSDQIELAQDKALEVLNQLRFLPPQNGMNMQAIADFYAQLAEGLFQGIEDGQATWVSVTIHDDELEFHKQVTFANESASSRFLASNKMDAMPLLTKLPDGAAAYYGFSGAMKELLEFGIKMSSSMSGNQDEEKKLDQEAVKLDDVKFGPVVSAFDIVQEDAGVIRAWGVTVASPVDKIREFSRFASKVAGEIETPAMKQTMTIQEDAETYGAFKGDVITVKQEFNENGDLSNIQKKMQQTMFGSDGFQTRNVYMDGKYATTVGGGKEEMKKLLKGLESSESNSIVSAREKLMKEANLLVLVDLPGLFGKALRVATTVEGFPFPINSQMVDSLNLKSTYLGMAVGSEPNTFKSEMHLPVEQIIGMTKLGVLIAGAAQPGF